MSDEKLDEQKVSVDYVDAVAMLAEDEFIHTFMNPWANMLMGADKSRESIINEMQDADIQIGGKMCRAMGHGLVMKTNEKTLFIQVDDKKIEEYLQNRNCD